MTYGYQKTQDLIFDAYFETVEKSWKKFLMKKVINKNMTKYKFFHFYSCLSICFAYNFFEWIFMKRHQRIWNQHEILRFLLPILNNYTKK
jgi:hypothetical protein